MEYKKKNNNNKILNCVCIRMCEEFDDENYHLTLARDSTVVLMIVLAGVMVVT